MPIDPDEFSDGVPSFIVLWGLRRRARISQKRASVLLGLSGDVKLSRIERNDQPMPPGLLAKARKVYAEATRHRLG